MLEEGRKRYKTNLWVAFKHWWKGSVEMKIEAATIGDKNTKTENKKDNETDRCWVK